jgi:hypothetical protein
MMAMHCDLSALQADLATANSASRARSDLDELLAILTAEGGTIERCAAGHVLYCPHRATIVDRDGYAHDADPTGHVYDWHLAHRGCRPGHPSVWAIARSPRDGAT